MSFQGVSGSRKPPHKDGNLSSGELQLASGRKLRLLGKVSLHQTDHVHQWDNTCPLNQGYQSIHNDSLVEAESCTDTTLDAMLGISPHVRSLPLRAERYRLMEMHHDARLALVQCSLPFQPTLSSKTIEIHGDWFLLRIPYILHRTRE